MDSNKCEKCIHFVAEACEFVPAENLYCISHRYCYYRQDPRKMPMNQCASLGEIMLHMAECRELDKQDKDRQFITETDFRVS